MTFDFEVLGMDPADYPVGPEDGVYIRGMFLEGCTFDPVQKMLSESDPKVPTHSTCSNRN